MLRQTLVSLLFPAVLQASGLWESGKMPCDVSTAQNKIRIAMDLHVGSPECTFDRSLENFTAGSKRAYLVVEAVPRSLRTGTEYVVGSENEALINITSIVMVRMLLQEVIEAGKKSHSRDLDVVRRTVWRNIASLAFSGQLSEIFSEKERPELLRALAKDPKMGDLSLSVELGANDEQTWKDFEDRFSWIEKDCFKAEKNLDEKFLLYREIVISILSRYVEKLSDSDTAQKWQAPLTAQDLDRVRALLDARGSFSEIREKWALPLNGRLSLLRNASIERAIAEKYCATLQYKLPVISRLGISHVENIFRSLQKRFEKSGVKWNAHLELDARALGYASVELRFARDEDGIKQLQHYRDFAQLILETSNQN